MKRLINLLRLALARYAMHCLEIQLHDQTVAMARVKRLKTYRDIFLAREATQRELCDARRHYISLLPPGQRRTWRTA